MEIIRKGILLSALGVSIALAGVVFYNPHPCLTPLEYSIGRVDEEFSVGTSTFRDLVRQAERPWEEAAGKELFRYNPDAQYTVNLIFDERQRRSNQSQEARETLESINAKRKRAEAQARRLQQEVETARRDFEQYQQRYDQNLSSFNEKVEAWNQRGPASGVSRSELESLREELSDMETTLEQKRQHVLALGDKLQQAIDEQQRLTDEYNEKADTFHDRYDQGRQFEQGTFSGDQIGVYQYRGTDDLRLVLAHEFGHALGIAHVQNPASVMYYLMEDQSLATTTLTRQDERALRQVCENASYFTFFN